MTFWLILTWLFSIGMTMPKPLLLMLDYDGTLTPIVPHFDQAQVSQDQIDVLRKLASLPAVQLAIVSGRSVPQLRFFLMDLAGESLYLVGLHGGEVYDFQSEQFLEEPDSSYKHSIEALKQYLEKAGIHQVKGVALEDKNYSLGVHYRQASPEDAEKALGCLREGMKTLGLSLSFILRPGKQLLEAVPKGFNKGVAVDHLLPLATKRFGQGPSLTYIGDDVTDFDAFRQVNAHGGQSIYVGQILPEDSPPVAQVLPNVQAVYDFLERNILSAV